MRWSYVVALGGLFGVLSINGCGNNPPPTTSTETPPPPATHSQDPSKPVIAEKGPYPKVVTTETEFDFGVLEINQEGKHEFVIRNEGEADLVIKKGPTSCKCTLSEVGEKPIPPGADAKVLLTWKPAPGMEEIRQTAEIFTNDPKRPTVSLVITGKLQQRLRIFPSGVWPVNDIVEGTASTMTGHIVTSVIDDFEISEIDTGSPLITVEKTPIDDAMKKELSAKTGFTLKVTVAPTVPVGGFSYPMKVTTNVMGRDNKGELTVPIDFSFNVVGKRSGPLRILGPEYREQFAALTLGSFDSTRGKKATLKVIVQQAPEEGFQLSDLKVTPKELKVSLEPDPKVKSRSAKGYLLTVEYPAGAPRVNLRQDAETPGVIEAKTNHPGAGEFRIEVFFNAY